MRAALERLAGTERTLLVGPSAGATAGERSSQSASGGGAERGATAGPEAANDPDAESRTVVPGPVRRFCRAHNVAVRVDDDLAAGACRVVAAGESVADGTVAELAGYVAGDGPEPAVAADPSVDPPDPSPGTADEGVSAAGSADAAGTSGRTVDREGGTDVEVEPDATDWSVGDGGQADATDWPGGNGGERGRPAVVDAVVGTVSAVEAASTAEMVRVSKEIERRAWRAGGGRLRAGFQELSVLVESDETYEQYVRLASAGVDVVVYGYPDVDAAAVSGPDGEVDVVEDEEEAVRDYWFVLFDGDGDDRLAAALVCEVDGDGRFSGYWTRDASLVRDCFGLATDEHPELFDLDRS